METHEKLSPPQPLARRTTMSARGHDVCARWRPRRDDQAGRGATTRQAAARSG
jgi:hypothetical protein